MTNMKDNVLKSNDNRQHIELPLPPLETHENLEIEIYARFMRHMRLVPNSRLEIKILSAIQFTSDMMDASDALVAKTLVDLGLRAPRRALPQSYLEHVDKSLMRSGWDLGGPCASTLNIKSYWDAIGEDRFASFRKDYPLVAEPARV